MRKNLKILEISFNVLFFLVYLTTLSVSRLLYSVDGRMSNECEAVGEMGIIMTTFGWEV
jgi:hypothetical protein